MDSGFGQCGPDDIAHGGRVRSAEGSRDAEPAVCPKVFQGWIDVKGTSEISAGPILLYSITRQGLQQLLPMSPQRDSRFPSEWESRTAHLAGKSVSIQDLSRANS